ncbi:VOC family protein [Alphaproteobacteria bacterium]|nr:VOC family protein [Alphaproteobacteria bacterium]
MAYHHLALATRDMKKTHDFYERVMGFELVKVEVAPVSTGGWGKHFFYRMDGDDSRFIAFWALHDVPAQEQMIYDLNAAGNLPPMTNHFSFSVFSKAELNEKRQAWLQEGLDVFEIDHNWCHSIYTSDPDGNAIEYCLTTGGFSAQDRAQALATLDLETFQPSPEPGRMKFWKADV